MIYRFIPAKAPEVPILISVPHCGVAFPDELTEQYDPALIMQPDDTDWFVDRLYDFASSMGMPMIAAHYSRWVIDLNRDPDSKPLYNDGRIITALCPTTTFLGQPLYKDKRTVVEGKEVQRRVKEYFFPYHQKIEEELANLKEKFGKVLLWDCHSIRKVVPTIQNGPFPDLILGDADGTSASPGLIETALHDLERTGYYLSHNHPFKGGYITRHFGKPSLDRHALQLEMTKVNYMADDELHFDEHRALKIKTVLQGVFEKLMDQLS